MKNNSWEMYTARELKPRGWLRRQLELQAAGLCGHLDTVWRDVRDSAWLGGDAESWERVPYWLDGFIPLAYLLDDADMIARARKYVDAIIAHQEEDGWICPCPKEERATYDLWAVLLISKTLTVYYECSGDERIPRVLYRVLSNFYALLSDGTVRLNGWGKFRWFEGFIAINKLYSIYREDWLVSLARILREQGEDYNAFVERWKTPLNKWTFETHIVNVCMALKAEAVSHGILGEEYTDLAGAHDAILRKYNGCVTGLFTGDECLGGLSPIRGTELCAVVEQMYSYELLYAASGDKKWAQLLELVAFNALAATISDDMWTHQYDQQSNQIACIRFPGKSLFGTNDSESHLFGLEPNYGCCTANFGQGWPKFALSAFMHRGDTILSAVPIPSVLTTCIGGVPLVISLRTEYPFENVFTYEIEYDGPGTFDLEIRVPSFAKNAVVNGAAVKSGRNVRLTISGSTVVTLAYDTEPRLVSRPGALKSVQCGSLVFSLPIAYEKRMYEYERDGVERKFPYCDYEYVGTSDWGYAFCSDRFEKVRLEAGDVPFSSDKPPVALRARMKRIDWGCEVGYDSVCAQRPRTRRAIGGEEEVLLYPYGCAKLRMTEMPLVK